MSVLCLELLVGCAKSPSWYRIALPVAWSLRDFGGFTGFGRVFLSWEGVLSGVGGLNADSCAVRALRMLILAQGYSSESIKADSRVIPILALPANTP